MPYDDRRGRFRSEAAFTGPTPMAAAARWVRRAAARALGIHINSMTYRVERIESLAGLSLGDPETRVAGASALRARDMLGM